MKARQRNFTLFFILVGVFGIIILTSSEICAAQNTYYRNWTLLDEINFPEKEKEQGNNSDNRIPPVFVDKKRIPSVHWFSSWIKRSLLSQEEKNNTGKTLMITR